MMFSQRLMWIEPVVAFFDGCELSAVATDAFVELIKPFPVIVHPPFAF